MGSYNIGPCECCGAPIVHESCGECLAAIESGGTLDVLVAGFTDGSVDSGTVIDDAFWSNLNIGYSLTYTGGSSWEILLGTSGDPGDRGILIEKRTVKSTGEWSACYAWKLVGSLSCNGVTGKLQFVSAVFSLQGFFDDGDPVGCRQLPCRGGTVPSLHPPSATVDWELACNSAEPLTGSQTPYDCPSFGITQSPTVEVEIGF